MKNNTSSFKQLGYFKEYYQNGKLLGLLFYVEKDRDKFGWFGQKDEITEQDIILSNNKKIKKGTKVQTQLHIICGKNETV
jgi:hypothetical protein